MEGSTYALGGFEGHKSDSPARMSSLLTIPTAHIASQPALRYYQLRFRCSEEFNVVLFLWSYFFYRPQQFSITLSHFLFSPKATNLHGRSRSDRFMNYRQSRIMLRRTFWQEDFLLCRLQPFRTYKLAYMLQTTSCVLYYLICILPLFWIAFLVIISLGYDCADA